MKKYVLIERVDTDTIHTRQIVSSSDNLSYINKRMEKLFLEAVEKDTEGKSEFDRSFFVNEYARIGDKSWEIRENK